MPLLNRRRAVALLAAGVAGAARAQRFPERPVTLIVPYPAGGPTDRHLRVLAEIAGPLLGQPVIVDNRPGANGTLGPAAMALNAKPDGHTLSQFHTSMLRYPVMNKTAWHPIEDFSFIAGLSSYTFGLLVSAESPWRGFADLVAAARNNPGALAVGSAGVGSTGHLLLERVAEAAGVRFHHVPFKGSADMLQALVGGHISAASDASGWDKLVDTGRLRLLLTFGERPTRRWPQAPTARSLGHEVVENSPYGIVGPRGMDPAVVTRLQAVFHAAMGDARNIAVLEQLNQEPWVRDGVEFRAWAQQTLARERALLDRLGLAA